MQHQISNHWVFFKKTHIICIWAFYFIGDLSELLNIFYFSGKISQVVTNPSNHADLGNNLTKKKKKKKIAGSLFKAKTGSNGALPKEKKKKEKNAARKERKATKTLAIVLGNHSLSQDYLKCVLCFIISKVASWYAGLHSSLATLSTLFVLS